MTRRRLLLGCAGALAAVAGGLLIVVPGLAADLTTSDALVAVLGVVALTQAAIAAMRATPDRRFAVPTPEHRREGRIPGQAFDERLSELDVAVRERLRATAIDVLSRFGAETRSTAERRIVDGTWTENAHAAAFFTPAVDPDRTWRPEWLRSEPLVAAQAGSVVDSLAAIVDEYAPATMRGSHDAAPATSTAEAASSGSRERQSVDGDGERSVLTNRWRGVEVVTILTVAVAALVGSPSLLLVSGLGVALIGYAAVGRAGTPRPVELAVDRTLDAAIAEPGDEVTVTVTVRNEGDHLISDLRYVDGVPADLRVADGPASRGMVLRAGGTSTFSYTVETEYGTHPFGDPIAVVTDVTGARQRSVRVDNDGTRLRCRRSQTALEDLPTRRLLSPYTGPFTADESGSGVQFHETREYHAGDPISLIDWKSLARTGELTALEFTEERLAEVVIAIDGRAQADLVAGKSGRRAVAHNAEAADRLVEGFLEDNNRVGVAILSTSRPWLAPGSGSDHRLRARRLIEGYPSSVDHRDDDPPLSPDPSRFRRRLSTESQVVVLSPLCDDGVVSFVRRLDAAGTPTTVISLDPTTAGTRGRILEKIERSIRIATLRREDVPVYDWSPTEPLSTALERNVRVDR